LGTIWRDLIFCLVGIGLALGSIALPVPNNTFFYVYKEANMAFGAALLMLYYNHHNLLGITSLAAPTSIRILMVEYKLTYWLSHSIL